MLDTLEQLTETYGFGTTRDGVETGDGFFFLHLCPFLLVFTLPHLQTAKQILYNLIVVHKRLDGGIFSLSSYVFFHKNSK